MIDIGRYIAAGVRGHSAYHVPPGEPAVKLDAMENPYRLPLEVRDRWLHALRDVALNRYPAPGEYERLKERLARTFDLPPTARVLLGNGSDEILQSMFLATSPEVTVVAPTPTFVMYEQIAALLGRRFVGVPLSPDFRLDVEALKTALTRHAPALVFLAYPNNPTGTLYERAEVEALLALEDALIVVDEAYYPFARASVIDRLGAHPQLLVVRTFSKQGLAGLRFGWLAGDAAWIDEIDKVRLPYNVSTLAVATAEFALDYQDVFEAQAQRIRDERERLYEALARRVTVWPSAANFLLFRVGDRARAADVLAVLKERGIWVKDLSAQSPALAGCLRVTVGTPEENSAFLAALSQAL